MNLFKLQVTTTSSHCYFCFWSKTMPNMWDFH